MACDITSGRIEQCKDSVSGIKSVYIINFDKLNSDSVTYLTIDGLRKAIGVEGLCTACLDGNYPTDVSKLLSMQGNKRPYEVEE